MVCVCVFVCYTEWWLQLYICVFVYLCICISADCMVCVCVLYRVVAATVYLLLGRDPTGHTYTGGLDGVIWYGMVWHGDSQSHLYRRRCWPGGRIIHCSRKYSWPSVFDESNCQEMTRPRSTLLLVIYHYT